MPEWAAKIHMCVRALLNEGERRTNGEGREREKDSIRTTGGEGGSFVSDTVVHCTVCA